MAINRSEIEITGELSKIFGQINSASLLFFTDIMRVGYLPKATTRDEQLEKYYNLLVRAVENRTMLFPTFNYDFCRTGIYDVIEDKCQVGTLNEFIRKRNPQLRTLTPVFNFSVINNNDYYTGFVENVFSKESIYGQVVKNRGTIVLYGRFLPALGHHLEEIMKVSYRYPKKFHGKIINNGSDEPVTLNYRVRPRTSDIFLFDDEKIYKDLESKKMIKKHSLGNGFVYWYKSDEVFDYWCDRLQDDEHYLLTENSKISALRLYERYGYPLSFDIVEN